MAGRAPGRASGAGLREAFQQEEATAPTAIQKSACTTLPQYTIGEICPLSGGIGMSVLMIGLTASPVS